MTTFDYTRTRATADRLLARFGQAGHLRRLANTGTSYNPTVTETDHACTFVVDRYRAFEIDGSRILATDKKVMLSKDGLAIEPTPADLLLIGGVAHKIVDVEPLSPAGTVLMWTVQARR